jgi:hypothetical protein
MHFTVFNQNDLSINWKVNNADHSEMKSAISPEIRVVPGRPSPARAWSGSSLLKRAAAQHE